ncbi:hypothetical protein GQ600_23194 [Phytophthora cactorum]|nr:hypothetical protein GQ600_23194 [Phytophthora cactorum]
MLPACQPTSERLATVRPTASALTASGTPTRASVVARTPKTASSSPAKPTANKSTVLLQLQPSIPRLVEAAPHRHDAPPSLHTHEAVAAGAYLALGRRLRCRRSQRVNMPLSLSMLQFHPLILLSFNQQNLVTIAARVRHRGQVVWDYRLHFKGTERDDPDYRSKLQNLNQRIAQRLLHLCFQNGGIYTKFGQQVATFNHGLPKEYTETLAQLQDQAMPVSFDKVKRTLEAEMGDPGTRFSKSLTRRQLHLRRWLKCITLWITKGENWLSKSKFKRALLSEVHYYPLKLKYSNGGVVSKLLRVFVKLDFENEKNNSRRVAACFKNNSNVHVPVVYDDLSTKRMMSMEFITAPKISQIEAIRELGLDRRRSREFCVKCLAKWCFFADSFIAIHTLVTSSCAGIRPQAKRKEQIVLLDHGLYRELDGEFRKTYCDLWRAMLMRDSALLDDCGRRLNVGELAKYLPVLFTYRTINHKGRLDASMSESERQKLSEELKNMRFSNVRNYCREDTESLSLVRIFPGNLPKLLSTNSIVCRQYRERFTIMGDFAVSGHSAFYSASAQGTHAGILASLGYWWEHFNLVFRLRVVDYVMAAIQYTRGEPPAKIKRVG